jgi:voltage-gated potassium channel Kch
VALDTPERTLAVVRTAPRHFPQLTILARAFDWIDAQALMDAGVEHVYREALDSSLRLGALALRLLGFRAFHAERAVQTFLRHDEETLRHLAAWRDADRAVYLCEARRRIEELEQLLLADLEDPGVDRDAGWDPESLRAEYGGSG